MIKKFVCDNGVRIVLEEIPTVRSAAIGVWIGTGSRDETPENNGISHFLEHMFFKGTETKSAKDIAEGFDSIGGQVNAFTSKEYTCYYAKVLDNHAPYALNMLADMFFNSTFIKEEMDKEKSVVAEEIKMYEDTPDDIVHDMLSKAVFQDHPLGYSILGTEETLASFTRDKLKQYMHDMYTPDRIVISIAGNVKPELVEKASELFGSFKGGSRPAASAPPQVATEKMTRKKDTEQAHLCLGFEGLPIGHESVYSLIVLNNILGGSMSSRLFQEVREERGLAYSVFSYHSAFRDSGLMTIYGGTGANQLDELFSTIQRTLASLKEKGVNEKEVRNSKEQLKASLMMSLESTNSRMSRNGKNELLLKEHRSLDEIVRLIDQVSIDSVNKLGNRMFEGDFSASLISPEGKLPINM